MKNARKFIKQRRISYDRSRPESAKFLEHKLNFIKLEFRMCVTHESPLMNHFLIFCNKLIFMVNIELITPDFFFGDSPHLVQKSLDV